MKEKLSSFMKEMEEKEDESNRKKKGTQYKEKIKEEQQEGHKYQEKPSIYESIDGISFDDSDDISNSSCSNENFSEVRP